MPARTAITLIALVLASCGGPRADRLGSAWHPGGLLLVGSSKRVVSLDPVTGSVVADLSGVPALGGWSTVFTTSPSGGHTILQGRDAGTGKASSSLRLAGEWSVRVVAWDGSQVALMAPHDGDPWIPEPRATTTMVVADPKGKDRPLRLRLRGNYEPEAFSSDGRNLYLIEFVPPADPDAYRVARLRLSDGRIFPVNTGTKGVVETMSGTRLEQVASPDGTMLYTLYTTEPAAYAEGGGDHDHVAFVHVLDLDDGWAHCIGLPREFWNGDPATQAMAVTPDGRSVYIVDTARSLVAVMDAENLDMSEAQPLDLGTSSSGEAHATVADEGLVVAAGRQVVSLLVNGFRRVASWTAAGPVAALASDTHGVYVVGPSGIEVLDPLTGRRVASVASPPVPDVEYVGVFDS